LHAFCVPDSKSLVYGPGDLERRAESPVPQ
jgi:hypothetical protein